MRSEMKRFIFAVMLFLSSPGLVFSGLVEADSVIRNNFAMPPYDFSSSENFGRLVLFLNPPTSLVGHYRIEIDDKPVIVLSSYLGGNGNTWDVPVLHNKILKLYLDPGQHKLAVTPVRDYAKSLSERVETTITISPKKSSLVYFKTTVMYPTTKGKFITL